MKKCKHSIGGICTNRNIKYDTCSGLEKAMEGCEGCVPVEEPKPNVKQVKQFERIQTELQKATSGKELLRIIEKFEADAILYCDSRHKEELYPKGGEIKVTRNGKLKYLESSVEETDSEKVRRWRSKDIFPGEWVGTAHEKELEKELNVGDMAMVVVDSQFSDDDMRRIGSIGKVIYIDDGDEWAYQLLFSDERVNWFKRHHLEKIEQ